jgi:hypothetical protein
MNFRSYIIVMALATLAAWISWALVMHGIDPVRSGTLGFFLFFMTLDMAILGSMAIVGVLFRLWRSRGELASRIVVRSLRQGILLSSLFIASLVFFSHGWFRWWTMLLMVLIAAGVELAFLSSRRT